MPEQNNDRLEQFFRKAAAKADITFNEEDWKKLEARLDAADAGEPAATTAGPKITALVIVGILVVLSTALWVSSESESPVARREAAPAVATERASPSVDNPANQVGELERAPIASQHDNGHQVPLKGKVHAPGVTAPESKVTAAKKDPTGTTGDPGVVIRQNRFSLDETNKHSQSANDINAVENRQDVDDKLSNPDRKDNRLPVMRSDDAIRRDLMDLPERDERYEQKAVVQLPGAEEEDTREAESVAPEEQVSERTSHMATPRLSLLLFLAPDFSGTSMVLSSAPGKAFGAMVYYHPHPRWSISGGVIKNYKQYTGSGEDYRPPEGYWKYYTNGVIPETIDGSCDILEFPVMIQYTLKSWEKSRLSIGGGLSSYLMQTESYRYHFKAPNPGAKDGWNSGSSSEFFFNMVNFTLTYERQVLPRLMLGIEPYAKIPRKEIGWSNLKLFSSGVSFTLRYSLLQKRSPSIPVRSRPPD